MRKLIRKEKEVLDLYLTGMAVEEMAKELMVSSRTVQFHLDSVEEKIGLPPRPSSSKVAD